MATSQPVNVGPSDISMAEMQATVINRFRTYFEPEGLVHFDIAAKNMEIAGLKFEITRQQATIEELKEGNHTPDATEPGEVKAD